MHIAIANVLSAEETKTVRAALEHTRFIEGEATAGFAARTVKNNRQAAGIRSLARDRPQAGGRAHSGQRAVLPGGKAEGALAAAVLPL